MTSPREQYPSQDDQDTLLREIKVQEEWLAKKGMMPDLPLGLLERTKLRVEISSNEDWLAQQAYDVDRPGALQAAKRAVALELASAAEGDQEQGDPSAGRLTFQAFRDLAVAAAILLVAGIGLWNPGKLHDASTTVVASVPVLIPTMETAFDDEESEWMAIANEIDALEDALAVGNNATWDDNWMDDISGEIDWLLDDLEADPVRLDFAPT